MELAMAFGRPDVDAFLASITHEQYVEWVAFAALRPFGWRAANMLATRQAWATVQSQSRRPIRESALSVRTYADALHEEASRAARMEAYAIRSAYEQGN